MLQLDIDVKAQHIVIDETISQKYRKDTLQSVKPKTVEALDQKNGDKSFKSVMMKLGSGLVNKLKRRLNLEEIKDKVAVTKETVKYKFRKKEPTNQTNPVVTPVEEE